MKKILYLALILMSVNTFAQRHLNYERFLIAGPEEGAMLIDNYISPALTGMMNLSGASWYSTAETHSRFGFDLTINTSVALVSGSDENFNFDQSKYSVASISSGEMSLPTIAGPSSDTPQITAKIPQSDGGYLTRSIEAPNGVGVNPSMIPSVMIQGGLGIGWGTEIKVRYVPSIGTDTFKANMWGVAIQHDIFQYIPFEGKIPVHISVLGGYSNTSGKWTFNEDDNQWEGDDQYTDFEVKSYTFQVLASTNIPIINFYAGLGYNSSKSSYKMNGTYEIEYEKYDSNDINTGNEIITYTNPASTEFDYSGVSATFGTRLSLGFFKLFADYTFKEYNTATLGISFSFR